MISFIGSWTQGIIVAVIISGIIEMLIPKGNMKKYISVIIGIYILVAIISPISNKIVNKDVYEMLDIDEYTSEIENSENKIAKTIETNSNNTIKDIYVNNLKSDMKNNIKTKGYEVKNLYLKVKDDENYTIELVEISLNKSIEADNVKQNNKIQIDDIVISKQENNEEDNELSDSDTNEIKDYLSETYKLDKDIINVY